MKFKNKKRITNEFRLERNSFADFDDFVARQFYFKDTCLVPPIKSLEELWRNIPDPLAKKAIATEHQYYHFQTHLLTSLYHSKPEDKSDETPLGLALRMGAIKAARLLVGSITEAALRSHAEKRKFKGLDEDERNRTLGRLIKLWKKCAREEFKDILNLAEDVRDARNYVHLYKDICGERNYTRERLEEIESKAHQNDTQLLAKLRSIVSS